MIKNYFKTAWRYLLKNKFTTIISIGGMALGVACFILLSTYLVNELRYDRFHKNAARIVRVGNHYQNSGDNQAVDFSLTPTALVPAFKLLPAVDDGVRIYNYSGSNPVVVQYGDKQFNEKKFLMADAPFFRIFSFSFLAGNARTALDNPGSVVITATVAKKYFGTASPLGKMLQINNSMAMQVTGVIKDVPQYSQIKFDMIGTYASIDRSKNLIWDSANDYSYLLLKPGVGAATAQKQANSYVKSLINNGRDDYRQWFTFENLTDVHLYSTLKNPIEPYGSINYVYILAAVALILLLLSCINFLNLVTAKGAERAREIGVRKVMGAFKGQLFAQFITEAFIITVVAVGLGLLFAIPGLNYFSSFSGLLISLKTWQPVWLAGMLLVLILVVTLLAGTYPSIYLASFKPSAILKGSVKGKSSFVRKGLVIFQFAVSVFFVICTIVVGRQLHYIQHRDTGVNRQQVLVVDIGGMPYTRLAALKNNLIAQPGIKSVTASYHSPVNITGGYTINRADGKPENFSLSVTAIPVEKDFVKATGIEIISGSNFSFADEKQVLDVPYPERHYSFIINRSAAAALGWTPEQAVGKTIGINARIGVVKAVTADFNFASLHQAITPVVMFTEYDWFEKLMVKVSAADMENNIKTVQTGWKSFFPNIPFSYYFLDEEYNAMYKTEQLTANILTFFTWITIFISCLGLFALAIFTTRQRYKEVSIRKVLGASPLNIGVLITSGFLKLVLAAIIVASPLAWYVMNYWLQDFVYRVGIQWWMFALAGSMALFVALITVSAQSVSAALVNPVKNLRE